MTLGTKLYNLRMKKNISLEELAYKIDVSKTAVGKWESDLSKPNIENLLKICDFYQIDVYSLLEDVSNIIISHNKFKNANYVAHTNNVTVHNAAPPELLQAIVDNQNKITELIGQQSVFVNKLLDNKN